MCCHSAGLAVRVPLTNSSITDCVFEVKRRTTREEVNQLLKVSSSAICLSATSQGAAVRIFGSVS